VYTFYYDETNNIRRLHLTESGLNVQQADNFILAGIAHKGLSSEADFDALFDSLNLQKTVSEVKLKHIAKGSFLDMLKSDRLHTILNWLNEQDFYLHYFNLNIIYWSIVDVIDSIIGELSNPFYVMHHMQLKSDFYELAVSDLDIFLDGLREFNYPDVLENRGNEFCRWLIAFAQYKKNALPDSNAHILCELLQSSLAIEDLPFVSGFHGRELISGFSIFYWRNLYLFINSRHVFDDEPCIEGDIEGLGFTVQGKELTNYEFVRSHDSKEIQISDVIAGFLGKYFSYLKESSAEAVKADKQVMSSKQKETLLVLKSLIDRSDEQSRGFFNVVTSQGEQHRNKLFLHDDSAF
tara:strand:+ start:21201 stop:22253 length:1053 start_codon:yes stop_codon:yes gene_type:complete